MATSTIPIYSMALLPRMDGGAIGLGTYVIANAACELVTLDSVFKGEELGRHLSLPWCRNVGSTGASDFVCNYQ